MRPEAVPDHVMRLRDLGADAVRALLDRFGLSLEAVPAGASIPGSFWGECEAGLIGDRLFARADTPVHSVLHESAHYVCMSTERRAAPWAVRRARFLPPATGLPQSHPAIVPPTP